MIKPSSRLPKSIAMGREWYYFPVIVKPFETVAALHAMVSELRIAFFHFYMLLTGSIFVHLLCFIPV